MGDKEKDEGSTSSGPGLKDRILAFIEKHPSIHPLGRVVESLFILSISVEQKLKGAIFISTTLVSDRVAAFSQRLKNKTKKDLVIFWSVLGGAIVVVGLSLRLVFYGYFSIQLDLTNLSSFELVSDKQVVFESDGNFESFYNTFRTPEMVVLLKKIVVNLTAKQYINPPMAFVELYVKADSKDTLVEIRDREQEIRDIIARELEKMNYDFLNSSAGKKKAARHLKFAVNRILTRGIVLKMIFKTLLLKEGR